MNRSLRPVYSGYLEPERTLRALGRNRLVELTLGVPLAVNLANFVEAVKLQIPWIQTKKRKSLSLFMTLLELNSSTNFFITWTIKLLSRSQNLIFEQLTISLTY